MEEPVIFDLRIDGLHFLDPNTHEPIDVRAATNTGEPINVFFGMTNNTTNDENDWCGNQRLLKIH